MKNWILHAKSLSVLNSVFQNVKNTALILKTKSKLIELGVVVVLGVIFGLVDIVLDPVDVDVERLPLYL